MPRPKDTPSTTQMLQAARLFYKDGLNKQDIAKRLTIDSRKVKWLLEQAKDLGVVTITFHETGESDLEDRLRQQYPHLMKVAILPGSEEITVPDAYADFLKRAAAIAARDFDEFIDRASGNPVHVGVSGGESVMQIVNAVPEKKRNAYIHVTSLVGRGRLPKSASHIDPIANASMLFSKCGLQPGHCEYATVPPLIPGPEARANIPGQLEQLAALRPIGEVIKAMDDIEFAFAGLGMVYVKAEPIQRARVTMTELLRPIVTPRELAQEGAQADMCYSLIDHAGAGRPEWEFFLTAGYGTKYSGVEFYKRMVQEQKKVLVIAGPGKIPALRAALAAEAFNIWITDQHSAEQLAKGR
jgi:DNA-binding transcriptional regulator LsrR (DeoR family)